MNLGLIEGPPAINCKLGGKPKEGAGERDEVEEGKKTED